MSAERKTKITSWWSPSANGYLLRAHHWGPHGASTKTVFTQAEAQGFFYQCDSRKPRRNTMTQESPAP